MTGRSRQGSERWQLRRGALLSDERLLPWVRATRRRDWPADQARRLELLERVLLDTRVEQDPEVVRLRSILQRQVVEFRPLWNGRRVVRSVVHRALRTEPRASVRRRAYYALEPMARRMEARVVDLVRLRNEKARAVGFRTFAEMRLGFSGVTPARVEELADAATRGARTRLARLREEGEAITGDGWRPWDFDYTVAHRASLPERSFARSTMLPRILAAVRRWGFRTGRMRFRCVFHDLPAGGLTLAPDPPEDVRILVHPQGGWPAYQVMFHEVGHAVHSASIRAPRHLLRWHENVPGFGGFHEGIGELFGRLASDPNWIQEQPGIDRSTAETFVAERRDAPLRSVAWISSWMSIEQALYRHPDRDPMPDAVRSDRARFGFDDYTPRSFVDGFWIDTPSYAPNYLLAALFQAQLAATLVDQCGGPLWPNPKVGPWLARNWFAAGSKVEWLPRLRELTGRPLDARAFRAGLAAA